VAQQEEEDDPEEHQGDAPVPATAGLLLSVGEDADRRVGLHRPVDLVQTSLKLFFGRRGSFTHYIVYDGV